MIIAVLGAAIAFADAQGAEHYPHKPIRLVIPFPPGGSNDVVGRILAQKLTAQMGVQVIVDNRGGASGNIAIDIVSRAAPDGYTMLLNSSGIVLTPALSTKVSYDIFNDFSPVALVSSVAMVLMVHPTVPVSNVAEFVNYAKANNGKLSYGTAGNGNITHLGVLMFLQSTGVDAVHIPYKGAGPALVDAIAGHTQFLMATIATAVGAIKDKRLKALAVTGLKRSPVIPDVPSLNEKFIPKFEATTWQGLLLPAKAQSVIVKQLNNEVMKALQDKDLEARFAAVGADPLGSTPDGYKTYLKSELERWTKVVKTAGIKAD